MSDRGLVRLARGVLALSFLLVAAGFALILAGQQAEYTGWGFRGFPSLLAVPFIGTGFLILNRLPRHHHPVFDSTRFERASDDRFFVSVEAQDPRFDAAATPELLREAGAVRLEWLAEEESR